MKMDGNIRIEPADDHAVSLLTDRTVNGEWSVPVMPASLALRWALYPELPAPEEDSGATDHLVIGPFGVAIAYARVSLDEKTGDAEIVFLAGRRDIWDRGVGIDTLLRLVSECIGPMGASHVWIQVPESQAAFVGAVRKIGFIHEATLRTPGRRNGAPEAMAVFGMLARKFRRIYGSDDAEISRSV